MHRALLPAIHTLDEVLTQGKTRLVPSADL
jgi:hypothetical protein